MARSTMSMARSTPAQNPRGLASSTFTASLRDLLARLALAPAFEDGVQDHQARPDRDGGVGDVEGREPRGVPEEQQEVDDVPEAQPVDDVADGAAEDQREPGDQQ